MGSVTRSAFREAYRPAVDTVVTFEALNFETLTEKAKRDKAVDPTQKGAFR